MFFVNQKRDEIINVNHIIRIYVDNDVRVMADTTDGDSVILGIYAKREKEAHEVFQEMLNTMFIPNVVAVNQSVLDDFADRFKKEVGGAPLGIAAGAGSDIRPYAREVYYMPEE